MRKARIPACPLPSSADFSLLYISLTRKDSPTLSCMGSGHVLLQTFAPFCDEKKRESNAGKVISSVYAAVALTVPFRAS